MDGNGTGTKLAIQLIRDELFVEKYCGQELYIHHSCRIGDGVVERMSLLPAFDEYIIAYQGSFAKG